MNLSTKTQIGMWIFTVSALAFGGLEIYGVTKHASDPIWPRHAIFHAVTGLFDVLVLCTFVFVLSWRFLKDGRRWSWWALALIGLAMFGGLPVGNLLSHGGLSGGGESLGHPQLFTGLAWLSVILWVLGLGLTWSHLRLANSRC